MITNFNDLAIFGEQIGVFLKNLFDDIFFAQFIRAVSPKRQLFANFRVNIKKKYITSVLGQLVY
jgi:hypothetical protein